MDQPCLCSSWTTLHCCERMSAQCKTPQHALLTGSPPPTPPTPPQVACLHLAPEPFTVENNMLTPTFKLKRPQAKAAYQQQLDDMYAQLGSGPA
jgi:hypothetical protein